MYVKQYPVNLNSVSTATALAAHDQEFTAVYAEHQAIATDFAGATAPQLPVANRRWLDTSTAPPKLKRYNGSAWVTEYIDHAVNAEKVGGNLPSNIYLKDSDQPSFRNKLINGNFAVNQRAVSGTVTLAAGQYGHDRWKAGTSGCTYTFATVANVTTLTITAGSLIQVIEGINLQSGTHVVSWQGTAQGKVNGSYADSGFTFTATGGTNASVEFGTGTLAKAQVEKGSVATEFEQIPIPIEEIICKVYHRRGHYKGTYQAARSGYSNTFIEFDPPMRVAPSVAVSINGTPNAIKINDAGTTTSAIAVWVRSNSNFLVNRNQNGADGDYIEFDWTADAEL